MPEEEKQTVNEEAKTPETNYIDAIQQLKENSVNKEDYDKLLTENKQLLDAMINGKEIQQEETKPQVDIDQLRRDLYSSPTELNNLDYVTKTLELRQALIDKGEVDPFLPQGHQISPTLDDIATANRVAQVYQECVDYADGDSEVFTNELMRRTTDSMPSYMSKGKRK